MRPEAKLCALALLSVIVTGCGARYSEYRSATEIPQGPGMFSGKDGAFLLYSDDRRQTEPDVHAGDRESREYQAFRRWKEINVDTPEYLEFEAWREWKAYRAWRERSE